MLRVGGRREREGVRGRGSALSLSSAEAAPCQQSALRNGFPREAPPALSTHQPSAAAPVDVTEGSALPPCLGLFLGSVAPSSPGARPCDGLAVRLSLLLW